MNVFAGIYLYIIDVEISIVASEVKINPVTVLVISTHPSIYTGVRFPIKICILPASVIEYSRSKGTFKLKFYLPCISLDLYWNSENFLLIGL